MAGAGEDGASELAIAAAGGRRWSWPSPGWCSPFRIESANQKVTLAGRPDVQGLPEPMKPRRSEREPRARDLACPCGRGPQRFGGGR